MKRADLPTDDEMRALEILGAAAGLALGRLAGLPAFLAGLAGVLFGRTLAQEPGRRGALSREAAYQLSKLYREQSRRLVNFCSGMTVEAKENGLPDLPTVRAMAITWMQMMRTEFEAAEEALQIRARSRKILAKVRTWCAERKVREKLFARYTSSPLPGIIARLKPLIARTRPLRQRMLAKLALFNGRVDERLRQDN